MNSEETSPPASPHSLRPRENYLIAWVCALFAAAISLPYLWAWLITPQGFVYGGLLYNPDDQNVHLAWSRQAHDGAFFFRDLFTTESLDARPLFTNLFAWTIGFLSRVSTLPLIFWYHAARVVFAVLALQWFARLVAGWTTDSRIRILSVAFAAFSMGGGLFSFLPFTFIDRPDGSLMMPEAWTFASALVFPLYIASMALIVLTLWQTQRAIRGERGAVFIALLAFAILTNIHTYDAIPLGLLLIIWTITNKLSTVEFDRTHWFAPVFVSFGALPPLLYQVWVFRNSAEFQQKALTPTPAPAPTDLFFSFAPLLGLGVLGVWAVRRKRIDASLFVALAWLASIIVCIYAPVSFARKMIEGVHWPLCFLAALGLAALLQKISGAKARLVAFAAVAFLAFSSANFARWCLDDAAGNGRREGFFMPPLYLSSNDWAALRALDDSADGREGAVLALPFLSNYVPRETGRTVFAGHWAETLNFWNPTTKTGKLAEVQSFFGIGRPMTAAQARLWLRKNRIEIVIVGTHERRWMKQFGGRLPLELRVWKQIGETTVYTSRER